MKWPELTRWETSNPWQKKNNVIWHNKQLNYYMTWMCISTFFMCSFLCLLHYVINNLPLFRNSQKSTSVFVWLQLKTKKKLQLLRTTALLIRPGTPGVPMSIVVWNANNKIPTFVKDWPSRAGFETRRADKELSIWTGSCLGCTHASSKVLGAVYTRLLPAKLEWTLNYPLEAKNSPVLSGTH